MGWTSWIALTGGLVALAALTPLFLGLFYPARSLAMQAIKAHLKVLGIDPLAFSNDCIGELANLTISIAKAEAMYRPGRWRSHLQEAAEGTAWTVHAIVMGQDDWKAEKIRAAANSKTASWVWQVLAEHDPNRFALDKLEMMQSTNALLRDEHLRRTPAA
jgi:hypothetical protein